MIRRSAKWSFRLGVLVAIALVIKKVLESNRPAMAPVVPTPPRSVPDPKPEPAPPSPPKPARVAVVQPKPDPKPEPKPEPTPEPEPEAAAPIPDPEPAPAPEPEPQPVATPEPTPAPAPTKKAAKKAAKRPPRTEPLRAQRLSKRTERPVRANRKVPIDAATVGTHSAMVSWVEPVGEVCPTSHPIKAKLGSKVFRRPGMPSYETSKPDRCYASEGAARRAGFTEAQR